MPTTEDRELIELIVAATATLGPEAKEEVRTRIGCTDTIIHYDFSPSTTPAPYTVPNTGTCTNTPYSPVGVGPFNY